VERSRGDVNVLISIINCWKDLKTLNLLNSLRSVCFCYHYYCYCCCCYYYYHYYHSTTTTTTATTTITTTTPAAAAVISLLTLQFSSHVCSYSDVVISQVLCQELVPSSLLGTSAAAAANSLKLLLLLLLLL